MAKVESSVVASPSAAQGDYIDALIVALQLLEERCAKGKWTRTIAVVSNGNGALAAAEDHIEQIRSQIEDSNCTITLALVDSTATAGIPSVKTELESVFQKFGAEVQHISTAADAEFVAKPPPVAPTTVFRGGLEISDRFSIGVWAYNGVSAVTAPSLKKMSIPATEDDPDRSGKVKMERAHFSVENPDTAIAPEEQIKAYKYGAEFVPFNQSDMIAFQWESTKSLQTLGFMPRSNLRRDHFADKCVKLVPTPGDATAEASLSVLKQALLNRNMVGIARLVKRKNDAPQLGALLPAPDAQECALLFMRLPFAEDLREFEFAALDATAPKPSTAQLDAAENLIRRMEVGDDWAPENVKNPALQRLHNCLQARVRDPDAPLDLQSPENTALSAKIAALKQQSKVADAIAGFAGAFQFVKNEGKATNKKRSYWGDRNRDGAGTSSGAAGGSKADDIFALDLGLAGDNQTIKSDPSMSSAFSAASFSSGGGADGTNADGSGAPKPALIFRGMVASAGGDESVVSNAVGGLQQRVREYLSAASTQEAGAATDKCIAGALECVQAYRKAVVDGLCPVAAFNDYLTEFRTAYKLAGKDNDEAGFDTFFKTLLAEKVSLVTKLEAVDGASPAQGEEFLTDPHDASTTSQEASKGGESEEEEDLFDLLM
eukprot:INCI9098.2.p1 GENE.INCI9098.2~~INCI9098.2.p1  ORF type:complete len:660 (+),score=155.25 INCI9098.2:395-2374(+)